MLGSPVRRVDDRDPVCRDAVERVVVTRVGRQQDIGAECCGRARPARRPSPRRPRCVCTSRAGSPVARTPQAVLGSTWTTCSTNASRGIGCSAGRPGRGPAPAFPGLGASPVRGGQRRVPHTDATSVAPQSRRAAGFGERSSRGDPPRPLRRCRPYRWRGQPPPTAGRCRCRSSTRRTGRSRRYHRRRPPPGPPAARCRSPFGTKTTSLSSSGHGCSEDARGCTGRCPPQPERRSECIADPGPRDVGIGVSGEQRAAAADQRRDDPSARPGLGDPVHPSQEERVMGDEQLRAGGDRFFGHLKGRVDGEVNPVHLGRPIAGHQARPHPSPRPRPGRTRR